MKKQSSILRAFTVIGPEEIVKLSEGSRTGHGRMVSGDSFVHWEDGPSSIEAKEPKKDAEIIPFPKTKLHFTVLEEPAPEGIKEENPSNFLGTDMALMQREIAKEAEVALTLMSAKKGYKSATEMFVVKSKDVTGKSKIRFASTHGVLVDKKQA